MRQRLTDSQYLNPNQPATIQGKKYLQFFALTMLVLMVSISTQSHAASDDQGGSSYTENRFAQTNDRAVTSELPYGLHCAPLRQQLSQLTGVMMRFDHLDRLRDDARAGELGLVGLLGEPPHDLRTQIANLQALSPTPVFFASDEESRSVQRLDSLIYRLPGTRGMLRAGAAEVTRIFNEYGASMRALGLHISFAPVADLGRGPGIGYRSFGTDADSVISMVNAVTDGFLSAGVLPVVKHFPGHGAASADSHDGRATTPPLHELTEQIRVFAQVLNRDVAVMVGHLETPELTRGQPASLSSPAIDGLLRQSLGFGGLVITDALGMSAITDYHDQASAGVKAIKAGADIALVSNLKAQRRLLDRLEQAVGQGDLSSERVAASLERVLKAKSALIEANPEHSNRQGLVCSDPVYTSQLP